MKFSRIVTAVIALGALSVASPALAHHPMGGETPQTLLHGLLSGVGHPIIGIDHFAFIVAVALASAVAPQRFLMPLAFVGATLVGVLLSAAGMALPLVELTIAASVVVAGTMVLSGKSIPAGVFATVFAVAGLFHGFAYADAIIGAETTPLAGYLIGLGITQYAVAIAVMLAARALWQATSGAAVPHRLAGAITAGIGVAFLVEHVETLVLGPL